MCERRLHCKDQDQMYKLYAVLTVTGYGVIRTPISSALRAVEIRMS